MGIMMLSQVINGVDYKGNIENINIKNISYDSRKITSDSLFIAIEGEKFDGHDFIDEAINRGAIAILVNENCHKNCLVQLIPVKNTRESLSKIADNFYRSSGEWKLSIRGNEIDKHEFRLH